MEIGPLTNGVGLKPYVAHFEMLAEKISINQTEQIWGYNATLPETLLLSKKPQG